MSTKLTPDLMANPQFKTFIDGFNQMIKVSSELSIEEGRRLCTDFFITPETVHEPVHRIVDIEVLGVDANKIPVRLFIPDSAKPLPVILYFHRGGWVFGNIKEADPVCRKIANRFNAIVACVEFRVAPENPFPKPLEDCFAATRWMAENAVLFGGDNKQLIVCGESCGGNLAAAVSLMARDNNSPKIAAQLLIYPIITSTIRDEPYDTSADRYFITKDAMNFFWSVYAQTPEHAHHGYASVERSNLEGLPPAVVITAEHDPLAHEGEEYAEKLRAAGVYVHHRRFADVIHGFLDLPIYEEEQKNRWIEEINEMVKAYLA